MKNSSEILPAQYGFLQRQRQTDFCVCCSWADQSCLLQANGSDFGQGQIETAFATVARSMRNAGSSLRPCTWSLFSCFRGGSRQREDLLEDCRLIQKVDLANHPCREEASPVAGLWGFRDDFETADRHGSGCPKVALHWEPPRKLDLIPTTSERRLSLIHI